MRSPHHTLTETLYDENIVLDKILWLGGIAASPNSCDLWRDFVAETPQEEAEKLFDHKFEEYDDAYEIVEEMVAELGRAGKEGFLVYVLTPVPMFHDPANDKSRYGYSFGHCRPAWFYTELLDKEFVERLVKWRQEVLEDERQLALKKADERQEVADND